MFRLKAAGGMRTTLRSKWPLDVMVPEMSENNQHADDAGRRTILRPLAPSDAPGRIPRHLQQLDIHPR